jgi:hypothetical protein
LRAYSLRRIGLANPRSRIGGDFQRFFNNLLPLALDDEKNAPHGCRTHRIERAGSHLRCRRDSRLKHFQPQRNRFGVG